MGWLREPNCQLSLFLLCFIIQCVQMNSAPRLCFGVGSNPTGRICPPARRARKIDAQQIIFREAFFLRMPISRVCFGCGLLLLALALVKVAIVRPDPRVRFFPGKHSVLWQLHVSPTPAPEAFLNQKTMIMGKNHAGQPGL